MDGSITVIKKHTKGSSIKDVRSQGKGGLSSADILRIRGKRFFRCRHPHFLEKKLRIFRNLWCVCTVKGGREVSFSRICADDLYGRPLTKILIKMAI